MKDSAMRKFKNWIKFMEEADLDFGIKFEPYEGIGTDLYNLLSQLYPIKILTVCSFMLQVWSLYIAWYILNRNMQLYWDFIIIIRLSILLSMHIMV